MSQLLRNLISRQRANAALDNGDSSLDGVNLIQPRPQSKFDSQPYNELQSNGDVTLGLFDSYKNTTNTQESHPTLPKNPNTFNETSAEIGAPETSTPNDNFNTQSSNNLPPLSLLTPQQATHQPFTLQTSPFQEERRYQNIDHESHDNNELYAEINHTNDAIVNPHQTLSKANASDQSHQRRDTTPDQFPHRVETILQRLNEVRSSASSDDTQTNPLSNEFGQQLPQANPSSLHIESNMDKSPLNTGFYKNALSQEVTQAINVGAMKQDMQQDLHTHHARPAHKLQQTKSSTNNRILNQLLAKNATKKSEQAINVSIGRIEIKAHAETQSEAIKTDTKPNGVMDLGDYLKLRNKERL